MQRKKKTTRPKFQNSDPLHEVWNRTREVYDEHDLSQKAIQSSEVAKIVMKRLALPMSNPIAVALMEYSCVQIAGAVLRHYFDSEDRDDPRQRVLGSEFSPRLQDSYGVMRNDSRGRREHWHVPRKDLTLAELQMIIKKLRLIGSGYLDHADALQKELETRFPEAAAS